ncbi:MAG TPA: cob(I)yrinic acid a,c-diamide adenosyltransferase, partial [Patescibacteria group bacterium]|nr:cob(I)yrinic acid a,c-diamide adenosyltransferase [Patescibacteria group bacterium]
MIQLFEGHGKGKTTAALCTALRAVGSGHKVAIVHFDKGGTHYLERDAISKYFGDRIELYGTGRDRIDPESGRFVFTITDVDKSEGERGLKIVSDIFARDEHKLVIMDEINSSADLGIVQIQ